MRYPADHKAETHERIIKAASRSYREHGSEGKGIARFMKDLGLTHGGFYRHFESKDDLYVAAVAKALDDSADRMNAAAKSAPKGGELGAVIDYYLSLGHLNDPASGCVIAALAPEFGRQSASVRERISALLLGYRNRLLPHFPGPTVEEKRRQFIVLFPAMAGVLMTARAMADPAIRSEILETAKHFYKQAFAAPKAG